MSGAVHRMTCDELQETYRESIQIFCGRFLRSREDRKDAAQEALLRACNDLDTFHRATNQKAWLYTIARNCCVDILRKQKIEVSLDIPDIQRDADRRYSTLSVEEQIITKEMVDAVKRRLDTQDRLLFRLTYELGMTSEEIAWQTGMNANTVRSHLARQIKDAIAAVKKEFGLVH